MAVRKTTSEKTKATKKPVRPTSKRTPSKKVATAPTAVENSTVTTANGLTSWQGLFQEAWPIFKQTFVSYLKLVGIGILLLMGIGLIGLIIGIPLMFSSGGSASGLLATPSPLQILGIVLIVLWAIASFLAMLAYFIFVPIASILILDGKEKLSLETLYKKSKPLLLPYFWVSLVVGFLVSGGWVLFIVPGVAIAILLAFTSYVVVLEGKRGKAALKRSYQMVKEHFWSVVLRILLIQAILFLGSNVLDNLAKENDLFGLVSFVFSITAGWFAQAYTYILYKQISKLSPNASAASIQWVWIVGVVGWLVILGVTAAIINGFIQMPGLQQSMQMMNVDVPLPSESI